MDSVCSQLLAVSEPMARSFSELEAIGIGPKEDSVESHPLLLDFQRSVQCGTEPGRYQVKLPWRSGVQCQELRHGEEAAGQRLDSLNCKSDRNPDLKEGYSVTLQEMEDKVLSRRFL